MIKAIAVLLLFQCLGETLSFVGNIPVPGPVIGMLLLLSALRFSRFKSIVEEPSVAFLKHLSLLFVPAGVGIVVYADKVEYDLLPIAATILLGTVLAVCITATTAEVLNRLIGTGVHSLPSPNALPPAMTSPDASKAVKSGEPS